MKGDWKYKAGCQYHLAFPVIPVTKQLLAKEVVHTVFEGEHKTELLLEKV